MLKSNLLLGTAIASSLMFVSMGVRAEEETADTDTFVLDELVITAQKREQSLQDVGISITALSGAEVEKLNFQDSESIAAQTPGLIATSFSGGSSTGLFSIRGISQNDFADHQEAPSAVYVDGVYQALTGSATAELFDVDRVEVLRGPQGTLFGRNATGGLVHVINKQPTEEFEAYAKLTVAEYNQIRLEGAVSGPITDTVRFRLAAMSDNADGYFENTAVGVNSISDVAFGGFPARTDDTNGDNFRGRDHHNIRAQLDIDLSENSTLGLDFSYGLVDNVGNAYDTAPVGGDGLVDLGGTDFFGTPFDPEIHAEAPNVGGFVDKKSISYGATYDYDADDWSLTAILARSENEKSYLEDDDGGPFNVALFGTDQDASTTSAEIRATGQSDQLDWTVGAYYLNIDGDYFGTFQFPGITGSSGPGVFDGFGFGYDLDYQLETNSFAIFAQVEYQLAEQWRLILGGRWTTDKKDFNIEATCVDDPAVAPGGCAAFGIAPGTLVAVGAPVDLELDDDFLTYKAQLEFQANEDLMIYAGYNRGVKAGNFTAPLDGLQPVSELAFRPEKLDAFEIGFKSEFADGRLRMNGSAFYYDYKDYQAFIFEGLTTIVRNFPAEITGGELEFTALPFEGLRLSGGVSILDATVEVAGVGEQQIILAPDVSFNWLARYETPVGDTNLLSFQIDGYYSDAQTFNTLNGPLVTGESYAIFNARIAYEFELGGKETELSLFVKNFTDETPLTYSFDLAAFFGNTIQVFGPPRIFGGSLKVNF